MKLRVFSSVPDDTVVLKGASSTGLEPCMLMLEHLWDVSMNVCIKMSENSPSVVSVVMQERGSCLSSASQIVSTFLNFISRMRI